MFMSLGFVASSRLAKRMFVYRSILVFLKAFAFLEGFFEGLLEGLCLFWNTFLEGLLEGLCIFGRPFGRSFRRPFACLGDLLEGLLECLWLFGTPFGSLPKA